MENKKKNIIIYYSVSGQTDRTALILADQFKANNQFCDLLKLETKQQIKPDIISRYSKGMKAMVSKDKNVLKPYDFKVSDYDRIILGFPNWASNCPPAMKEFIRDNQFSDKEIWLFTTYVARGGSSCLKHVKELLQEKLDKGESQVTREVKITIPTRKTKEQIVSCFSI